VGVGRRSNWEIFNSLLMGTCVREKPGVMKLTHVPAVIRHPDRHIEVKGRARGQTTITVTRNEIMYALNQQDKFILAIVFVDENDQVDGPYYVKRPFSVEPDWGVASVNYDVRELLK
jgi:hypothetical protein